MFRIICLILFVSGLATVWGCEDPAYDEKPGNNTGADGDGDSDSDGDGDGDSDGDGDGDASWYTPSEDTDCGTAIDITVRDFDVTHPDMERADNGWGPLAGVLEPVLGDDRKPVFADAMGAYTWKPNNGSGELEKNCWDSGPGTEELCYMGTIPMFEGAESFNDWYRDTTANQRFEKSIELKPDPKRQGVFVFDSDAFFPLSTGEGFGETPANAGQNFLFTTEMHLKFEYVAGQKFTFSGDDDLWIFVNGRIALDLGGLHLPFTGTIDFDAKAEELDIQPGRVYPMDIFHAERHTSQSNFHLETNISCFTPNPIIVE
jgi:fibro-slime domain-containing protein